MKIYLDKEFIKKQINLLKVFKIIHNTFTGKLLLNFKDGGITHVDKTETLR